MDNATDEDILDYLNGEKLAEFEGLVIVTALVLLLGIIGNVTSFVYHGFKARKSTTNYFIMYLAVTDFFACVIFIDAIVALWYTINLPWRIACQLMCTINYWTVAISGFMLALISVDRFRKICRPYKWQFKLAHTKYYCAGVVAGSLAVSVKKAPFLDLAPVNITLPGTERQVEAKYCTNTKDPDLQTGMKAIHVIDMVLFGAIFVLIFVLYTLIIHRLWRHRNKKLSQPKPDLCRNPCADNDGTPLETLSSSPEKPTDLTNELTTPLNIGNNSPIQDIGNTSDHAKINTTCTLKLAVAVTPAEQNATKENRPHQASSPGGDECQHMKKDSEKRLERNTTFMMIALTVMSLLSFAPYMIVLLAYEPSGIPEYDLGYNIAYRSVILTNALNPYVTLMFNPDFRRYMKTVLKRLICVRFSIPFNCSL